MGDLWHPVVSIGRVANRTLALTVTVAPVTMALLHDFWPSVWLCRRLARDSVASAKLRTGPSTANAPDSCARDPFGLPLDALGVCETYHWPMDGSTMD